MVRNTDILSVLRHVLSPYFVMIHIFVVCVLLSLPVASIWKLKVSSADNFLLDFNLPWRFTIFIHPTGGEREICRQKYKKLSKSMDEIKKKVVHYKYTDL